MNVAVVIPVYNVRTYLGRCVASVLAQDYKDYHVVLVDDGSTDESGDLCDRLAAEEARIHVIHQRNEGLSAARNAGIDWVLANSAAEAITFVDSDDWVEPDYLSKLVDGLLLGAEVACASFAFVEELGARRPRHPDRGWCVNSPEVYWVAPDATAFMAVSKLFRRELFEGVRFPVGRLHEDVFTTHKLVFRAKRVASCTASIYNYFIRSGSIMQAKWSPRRLDAIEALKQQRAYFTERGLLRAEGFARGRLLAEMARDVRLLVAVDAARASDLERDLKGELRQGGIPAFWETRDYYRIIWPRWKFVLRWMLGMMADAFCNGRRSWLVNESLPMLKLALFDWRRKGA